MQHRFSFFLIVLLSCVWIGSFPAPTHAGECFSEPYHTATGTATVKSAVFMRTGPCQTNTDVVATASAGAAVTVLAEDHEWYLIRLSSGATGWVWNSFLTLGDIRLSDSNRAAVEALFPTTGGTSTTPTVTVTAKPAASRLLGRILLQVEQHGEAWYVNPVDGARYYMKDGATAYEMMRSFGLGISEADYQKIEAGNTELLSRLKGKIILRVQLHGEAYYLHPDGGVFYLKDGPAAYQLMREKSLGIRDTDLQLITSKTLVPKPSSTSTPTSSSATATPLSLLPEDIDIAALNASWAERVNALREKEGLRSLRVDDRFMTTAAEWAQYLVLVGDITHERPNGQSMHDWINDRQLPFTERGSADGWTTNYFSENLAWTFTSPSQDGAEEALDDALNMFLSEGPTGTHYKTLFHKDWNRVGMSMVFVPAERERVEAYMVFHYGSLKP